MPMKSKDSEKPKLKKKYKSPEKNSQATGFAAARRASSDGHKKGR